MDAGQGLKEGPGRSRRLGYRLFVVYVATGSALAILRVSLLAWMEYRSLSDQMTPTEYSFLWILYPEELLAGYTRLGSIHFSSLTKYFLFWGFIQTLGSFILATPILLVGWLKQRR